MEVVMMRSRFPTESETADYRPGIALSQPDGSRTSPTVSVTMTEYDIVSGVASHILRDVLPTLLMNNHHRPTLYRIQWILARLVTGDRVTSRVLAENLEVSQRTIARDIDYLMNVLHVPMVYDYVKKSYVLTGPIPVLFSLPSGIAERMNTASEPETIQLAVDPLIAEHVRHMRIHPSQRFITSNDGSLILEMRLGVSESLAQWILSFGGRIRPIAPEHLKQRVRTAAELILADGKDS